MKKYEDLIKEGLIDFNKLLLDKYHLLKLSEEECIILYRLHEDSVKNNYALNLEQLSTRVSLDKNKLADVVAGLVEKGFISLKMTFDDNGSYSEEFSLDDAYKEFAFVLENCDKDILENETFSQVKNMLVYLETKNKKPLSQIEIEMVRKWFYEFKYEYQIILDEVDKTYKLKNPSISLVDRNLYAKTKEELTIDEIEEAQEILKRKYGKK